MNIALIRTHYLREVDTVADPWNQIETKLNQYAFFSQLFNKNIN